MLKRARIVDIKLLFKERILVVEGEWVVSICV